MRSRAKQRVLIGQIVIVAMAVCGIGLGYLMGCLFALIQANQWLEHYAEAAIAQDNAALAEARGVLGTMQSISSGACSESEIAKFRDLVFRSEYLKDAGQIQDGKIECSAALGHPRLPVGAFEPSFRQKDGVLAYSNLTPIQAPGVTRTALQLGSFFAVIGAALPSGAKPIPMQMAVTLEDGDASRSRFGIINTENANPFYFHSEGQGRVGNTLFATRCSTPGFNCVTATASIPEAIHNESDMLSSSAFAGGMAGVLIGMIFSILYSRSREMSQQLRRALQRGDLEVAYQPIVNLQTQQIAGAEALVRWTDEDGKAVSPELIVKTAEDLGVVGLLTKTVLQRALGDFAKTLRDSPGFRISINVTAADLVDPVFLPMLKDSLQKASVQPESLVLEITEQSAANSETAMETIRSLRESGHRIHIDDFGTGYSNLDKLLCLSADTIKIDKAFTRLIGTHSLAISILPQIMAMAKSLNLEVVVEGVETMQQADYFAPGEQKIYGQGWLYGRPMTAQALLWEFANDSAETTAVAEGNDASTAKVSALQALPYPLSFPIH